jgi:hypothetical protein
MLIVMLRWIRSIDEYSLWRRLKQESHSCRYDWFSPPKGVRLTSALLAVPQDRRQPRSPESGATQTAAPFLGLPTYILLYPPPKLSVTF